MTKEDCGIEKMMLGVDLKPLGILSSLRTQTGLWSDTASYLAILGIFGGVFILWVLLLEKVQTAPDKYFFADIWILSRGSVVMVYLIFQVTQNNGFTWNVGYTWKIS